MEYYKDESFDIHEVLILFEKAAVGVHFMEVN